MDGQREERKREPADVKMEKKYLHLLLSTMPNTILFYEKLLKINLKTLVKNKYFLSLRILSCHYVEKFEKKTSCITLIHRHILMYSPFSFLHSGGSVCLATLEVQVCIAEPHCVWGFPHLANKE